MIKFDNIICRKTLIIFEYNNSQHNEGYGAHSYPLVGCIFYLFLINGDVVPVELKKKKQLARKRTPAETSQSPPPYDNDCWLRHPHTYWPPDMCGLAVFKNEGNSLKFE